MPVESTLSEVLLEELEALRPDGAAEPAASLPTVRDDHGRRIDANEKLRLRRIYGMAYGCKLSALSLSGGGIRSASFALGIIQGLADKDLLRRFDYLSTVSGGGYVGSWLSAWLYHRGPARVLEQLRSRRANSDVEPAAIDHLREYSSYLTPKVGLLSADTWAAVAIVFRNILLNWLILLPAIALPVVVIKILMALVHTAASVRDRWVIGLVAAICLLLLSMSLAYKLSQLFSDQSVTDAQMAQRRFILLSLAPAIAAGACFTSLTETLATTANSTWAPLPPSWRSMLVFALIFYAGALIIYVGGKIIRTGLLFGDLLQVLGGLLKDGQAILLGWAVLGSVAFFDFFRNRARPGWKDVLSWGAAILAFTAVVWAGTRIYIDDSGFTGGPGDIKIPSLAAEIILAVFGIPYFLLATVLGHTTYLMLRSYSPKGDVEREWLGRASGWHLIAGLGWAVLSGLVLAGPYVYYHANSAIAYGKGLMAAIGALSGVITAILGKSSLTPAQGAARDLKGTASNIALAVAGPLFAIILIILLSVVLDWILVGYNQACFPLTATRFCSAGDEILVGYDQACVLLTAVPTCSAGHWSLIGLALAAVALVANFFVNVNRFSLHTLYRNRLIRAFLGAPREPNRTQDGFTGFDWEDNFRVASLWGSDAPTGRHWRPYHVINMTLNLASTSNLAWQQRKGESFIVSPKFCGSADLGYRPTGEYGDPHGGITLGTAMAISGAAVSPNMGYHSSPSIAFLLTFFNVRLGWWLGNPGPAGSNLPGWQRVLKKLASGGEELLAPYTQEAPWFAIRPLLAELFGLTTEKSPYVYLSDGGHFEDLALYEMVRRRCRWIIVCDGAEDRDRKYEDLGNAVRKIWIDLGVRIRFPESVLLESTEETKPVDLGYFALGTIEYSSDGSADELPPTGKILYIKPAVRGDEGAAEIIAYQRLNPDFPNQSTVDQWFNEPQLEAYRALGHYIMTRLVDALDGYPPTTLEELFDRLDRLDLLTLTPRPLAPFATNIC